MKKSTFTIDSIPGQQFEGFTDGEDWNGWACPYFPFETAQKIVAAHDPKTARYDEENDQFIFTVGDEEEVYPAVSENDRKLYPIGNGSWIWEISEQYQEQKV